LSKLPIDINDIFSIDDPISFNEIALKIFHYQYENVLVYQQFVDLLKVKVDEVTHYSQIPFLPVQFFKSHKVLTEGMSSQKVFKSSGTTGVQRSEHHVADLDVYEMAFFNGFKHFYGNPKDWLIMAVLPSYQEQGDSSLIYMVDHLIEASNQPESGYYYADKDELQQKLTEFFQTNRKVLLIGVSYALLDVVEKGLMLPSNQNIVVMETGGMKGRKKEMTRTELHSVLTDGFGVSSIHSEYGMTELLSQGYSDGQGVFKTPSWMKVVLRDTSDPLSFSEKGRGGINIIDLANLYSCSFIATQDLGEVYSDGSFSVSGRFDHSDTRGCNLLHLS